MQQAREEDVERTRAAYAAAGIAAEIAPFFQDLPQRMAEAHLVIARAGASTVAELAVIGRPSILVPLPHALDNDQLRNATTLAESGGAWCIEQKDLDRGAAGRRDRRVWRHRAGHADGGGRGRQGRRAGRMPWCGWPISSRSWRGGTGAARVLTRGRHTSREINHMEMPRDIGTIHILGIGGIGMSAIAEILHAKGFTVQGSDQKDSANVRRLRAKGMRVFVGHDAINLVGARFVVISTAVKNGNPELEAARTKGLPIIRRAEMLAELMRLYSTVSVTGTHGKTTTTSLVAHIFASAGLDPTVITGGIINDWGSNARLGKGPWMIVEADESDGTFIKLPTQIGIVTNIDPEHLDYFKTVENMHREFEAFFRNIPFYGARRHLHRPSRGGRDDRPAEAAARRPPPASPTARTRGADIVLDDVRFDGRQHHLRRHDRRAGGRRRPQAHRLAHADPRRAQCAECAGRDRRRRRGRHSPTTRSAARSRASPASSGASSRPAPGTASTSTTTTATTPSRSPPC